MALGSTRDIGIRYVLDVVDRGTRKLLAEDRQVRRSVQQTERILRSEGATARQVANATRTLSAADSRAASASRLHARAVTQQVRDMGRLERATRSAALRLREYATHQRTIGRGSSTGRLSAGFAAGGIGGRVGLPVAAGAAAAGFGGVAVLRNVVGFEKAMDKVNALLLTSGTNMARLNKLALDLGARTQFSARQAADAMAELGAAGFSTQQIIKTLPGTLNLAASAGTDLAFAANVQASALRQFGLRASESSHVADVMTVAVNRSAITIEDLADTLRYVGPVAGRFNQSFEDMSAATAILGNVGIVGTQAGTTLRRALVSLVRPSEKTVNVLSDAGISAREFAKITIDSAGNLRPLPVVLGNLAQQLEGVDKATRRRTLAQLFGTEALPGMITLFDKGEGAITKMARAFENSGGAAQRTAGIMRDNVAGAWENFTGSIETASIALLRGFTPALKDALNVAAGAVNVGAGGVGEFLKGLSPPDAEGGGGRRSPFQRERLPTRAIGAQTSPVQRPAARPPEVSGAQKAGEAVRGVFEDAMEVAKRAAPAVITFAKEMVDAFKPALPFWQNVLQPVIEGFGTAVIQTLAVVLKYLPPVVRGFATVAGAVGTFVKPLAPIFKATGYVIGLVLGPGIIKAVGGAVSGFGLLGRVAGPAIEAVGVAAGLAWRVINATLGRILPLLRPVAAFLGGRFTAVWRSIATVVRGSFGRVATIVSNVGRSILGAARNVVGGIGRAFGGVAGRVVGPVRGAFNAVVSSIRGSISRVRRAAGEIVSGIVGAFRGIGGKVGQAIAGIAGSIKGILNTVIGMVNKVIGGINALPNVDTPFGDVGIPDIPTIPTLRKGGRTPVRRFQGGGLVALSPGELLVDPLGRRAMVPGSPVAADSVLASVPDRTKVFTGHGQGLLAMGASYDQALAGQLPHFQTGGIAGARMAARSLGQAGVKDANQRLIMTATAGRESRWDAKAKGGPNSNGTYDHGFLQANDIWAKVMGAALWAKRYTWEGGGQIAKRIADKQGPPAWRLSGWAVNSTIAPFMRTAQAAVRSVGVTGGGGGGGSRLVAGGRLPSAAAAFAGGFQAGLEGTRLWDSDVVRRIVSSGKYKIQREGKAGGRGGASATGSGRVAKIIQAARQMEAARYPYHWGGGHTQPARPTMGIAGGYHGSSTRPGYDCSGAQARLYQAAGFNFPTGVSGSYTSRFAAGPGKQITLFASGSHTFSKFRDSYFGTSTSNPMHGPGWLGRTYSTSGYVARHPAGYRGGGVVRFQGGGTTPPFSKVTEDDPRWHLGSTLDKVGKRIEDAIKRGFDHISPRRDLGGRINQTLGLPTTGREGNDRFKQILRQWANRITTLDDTSRLFVEDQIAQLEETLKQVRQHIRQLRRGGVTRRERPELRRLRAQIGDTPDQISELRSSLTTNYGWQQLQRFEGRLGRRVSRLQRGSEDRQQRVQVRRLQAMQRVVQAELGRRLGQMVLRADQQLEGFGRDETRFGQGLRVKGIDETSAQGIGLRQDFLQQQVNAMNRLKAKLQNALKRAVRRKDRAAVSEIQGRLGTLEELIAESFTQLVESQSAQPQGSLTDPFIEMEAALAAVTPDSADDKAVAQKRLEHAQRVLQFVQASGASPEVITEAAQNLKAAMDALNEGTESTSDLAEQMKALTEEVKRQNDITESVAAIGLREAQRAIADLVSGQIQGVATMRGRSAGDGVTGARY